MYNEKNTLNNTEETDTNGGVRKIEQTDTDKEIIYEEKNGQKTPITQKVIMPKIEVTPGEIIEIPVDLAMSHDGTSPPAIKTFEKVATKVWDNEKIAIVFDHYSK